MSDEFHWSEQIRRGPGPVDAGGIRAFASGTTKHTRAKFGFPFLFAVKGSTKLVIMQALEHAPAVERGRGVSGGAAAGLSDRPFSIRGILDDNR